MASSSVMAENVGYESSQFEVPRIFNSDILLSFLEESQMEDADDERLTSVIQSLEAEISAAATGGRDDEMKSYGDDHDSVEEQLQLYDLIRAVDTEEMACSTDDLELDSILLEYSVDETGDAVMFVDIDEHQTQFWDGDFLEEHSYASLWQQPYNFSM